MAASQTEVISIRLTVQEIARIDELRPPRCSRSAFVKALLKTARGPVNEQASHDEALLLLADSARAGHVQAQVALERALRSTLKKEDEVDDAIERILAKN